MIRLSEAHLDIIRRHGAETFPYECVGVLLGDVEPPPVSDGDPAQSKSQIETVKVVREVRPLPNSFEPSAEFEQSVLPGGTGESLNSPNTEVSSVGQERRYMVQPDTMFQLMREERKTGIRVLGFYHSHPNHPAQPSVYDREWASPWYTYIIVSILEGKPDALTIWQLTEDRSRFEPEKHEIIM